ncbi:MAG: methionyl-tRNA formyltransferase [Flavobacteriaceae bacterium]|nr:methionyl-tRNA formyltransferase [Flavobacteriaceae bacterium]
MTDIRIVFMGTPDFAVGVLHKLVSSKQNVVGVITAPDRPSGRGRKLTPSAVKKYALEHDIPVLQPTNLKDSAFLDQLEGLQANLQIVVAFRMLPKAVWSMPALGTFNLHASLLPAYRGAAPINWAIINQEKITGVTTFFIDEAIDTGAILLSREVLISENETAGSLHDTLMEVGAELVLETITQLAAGNLKATPQPLDGNFHEAPKLHPENTRIDWSKPAEQIVAFIRGLSPYPAAWCQLSQGEETVSLKIYNAIAEIKEHSDEIGSLRATKKEIKVAVTNGFVIITELQLPGKKKMDATSLLNGYTFKEDAKLS